MVKWKILDSGKRSPQAIMELDAELLDQLQGDQPILHLYEWDTECLTYGYFIDPSKHLNLEVLKNNNIKMARRPTGGGIIFHLTDFAFSLLIPAKNLSFSLNTLENYAYVNQWVSDAICHLLGPESSHLLADQVELDTHCKSFCMAHPTHFDIISKGKKIGGAAQRRKKGGLLHQGSLSLALPSEAFLKKVLLNEEVVERMKMNSYALLEEGWTAKDLDRMRLNIKECLMAKALQS